jgi:hypothetical protein
MRCLANAPATRQTAVARAALALALTCAPAAYAGVHKCAGPAGAPVYQDSPCLAGKELRDFDKDPPTLSVMPVVPVLPAGTTTTRTLPSTTKGDARAGKSSVSARNSVAPSGKAGERKFIAPGVNEGEVMARLGRPDMKSGGGGRKTARWTYLPAPDDPSTVTTLTFENGRLVEVERKIVK